MRSLRECLRLPSSVLSRHDRREWVGPRAGAIVALAAATLALLSGPGLAAIAVLDRPPHLSDLTARMGAVSLQGGGTKRGVKGTYRLCDDGPPASTRSGVEEITHRWSAMRGGGIALLVRERRPSISWDVYFQRKECRSRIFWASTVPAGVAAARGYPCYSVVLRVRDPGGHWSRPVSRVVKRCPKR
jgi:hypothetical protein